MKTTKKMYIVSWPDDYTKDGIATDLWSFNPDQPEKYTVHGSIDVEYEAPTREALVMKTVESLEQAITQTDVESASKKQAIRDKINSLLALEAPDANPDPQ